MVVILLGSVFTINSAFGQRTIEELKAKKSKFSGFQSLL